jgi:hypothetical protein
MPYVFHQSLCFRGVVVGAFWIPPIALRHGHSGLAAGIFWILWMGLPHKGWSAQNPEGNALLASVPIRGRRSISSLVRKIAVLECHYTSAGTDGVHLWIWCTELETDAELLIYVAVVKMAWTELLCSYRVAEKTSQRLSVCWLQAGPIHFTKIFHTSRKVQVTYILWKNSYIANTFFLPNVTIGSKIIVIYKWLAWRIIVGSGSDESIYLIFPSRNYS